MNMPPLFNEKGDRFGRPAVNFYADESNHPFAIMATLRALVDAHARGDLPHIPLTELCGDAPSSVLLDHVIQG